jgi:hypothetical protein
MSRGICAADDQHDAVFGASDFGLAALSRFFTPADQPTMTQFTLNNSWSSNSPRGEIDEYEYHHRLGALRSGFSTAGHVLAPSHCG